MRFSVRCKHQIVAPRGFYLRVETVFLIASFLGLKPLEAEL